MIKMNIESTLKTPSIQFDFVNGLFEIKGRSIPEDSKEFYRPIVESLEKYGNNPNSVTTVNIKLEYFNTSSSKCMLDVFKKLEFIHQNANQLVINWYYERDDEDMLEAGEDYKGIINVPFKMIQIEE